MKKDDTDEKKDGKVLALGSGRELQAQGPMQTSQSLSKNLASELMQLIKDVNKDEVTPASVNAACNVASEINKLLKLNFEMKKADM